MRRFPLAFLLVGLLGLLAAGGAVLGAFQAPTGTDLAVHNAATATLTAARVAGTYTASNLNGDIVSFVYEAPGKATEVARSPQGVVKGRRSVQGRTATGILAPILNLLAITTFTAKGGDFVSTEPAALLAPAGQRAKISGTYRSVVHLDAGYVVSVLLTLNALEQGQHIVATVRVRLTSVGNWARH